MQLQLAHAHFIAKLKIQKGIDAVQREFPVGLIQGKR